MIETSLTDAVDDEITEAVPADRLHSLLSHPYRRFVLVALTGRDDPATVSELAERISDQLGDDSETAGDCRAIRIDLYHVHLPMLADADLIRFDPETKTVAPPADGPGPEALRPMLPSSADHQRR